MLVGLRGDRWGGVGGLSVCPHWFINAHTGRRGVDEGGGVYSAVKRKQ